MNKKKMHAFRFGDVFTVLPTKKISIPGKAYVMDNDIITEDGIVPYIAAISTNNGIKGYSKYEANNDGGCITLSTTADSSNTVFYQESDFIGRQQIAAIRRKDGCAMNHCIGLYISAVIRKLTSQFNYNNKLTKNYMLDMRISLPVTTVIVPDWLTLEALLTANGGGGGCRYE